MAVTRTPNLGLGLQLDKTDYLDWDEITSNWQKLDEAYKGATPEIAAVVTSFSSSAPPTFVPETINEPTPFE